MRKLKTLDLSTFTGTHIETLDAPSLTKFEGKDSEERFLLNVSNHTINIPNIVKPTT
jgi:hypothetical protein